MEWGEGKGDEGVEGRGGGGGLERGCGGGGTRSGGRRKEVYKGNEERGKEKGRKGKKREKMAMHL